MQKVLLSILIVFLFQVSFSQNEEICRELVNLTVNAINTKNVEPLNKHLASNFTIANQKGKVAKLVLKQLIAQMDDFVLSSKEISQLKKDHSLELQYNFQYQNIGNQESRFLFNKNNEIEKLELFKIKVKTLENNETQISYPTKNVIEIPFTLINHFIAVPVLLNNQKEHF